IDAKALTSAGCEQRREQMAVVILRNRLMNETDAALVKQFAVFILGIDDYEALLVVGKMALDQGQSALADRTEADHHDGPDDAGMHWPFRHRQSLQEGWSYPWPVANGIDAERKWPGVHDILPESCGVGGESGSWSRAVGRAQPAAGTFECARYKLDGEQAVTLERTGHAQSRGHFRPGGKTGGKGGGGGGDHAPVGPPT